MSKDRIYLLRYFIPNEQFKIFDNLFSLDRYIEIFKPKIKNNFIIYEFKNFVCDSLSDITEEVLNDIRSCL